MKQTKKKKKKKYKFGVTCYIWLNTKSLQKTESIYKYLKRRSIVMLDLVKKVIFK